MKPRVVLFAAGSDAGRGLLESALVPMFSLGEPTAEPCAAIGMRAGARDALALAAAGRTAALVLLHPIAEPVAGIDVPTLILWGEDDHENPQERAEAIHETIDSSSLGILPGCGAGLLEDAPQTVIPLVVEYLRSTYLHAPHGHAGVVPIQIGRSSGL
jgi:pimeloyl-ACP methyl ester carboxylesterase